MDNVTEEFEVKGNALGGLFCTGYNICFLCAAPIAGFVGDRYSKKRLLITFLFLWTLVSFLSLFSTVISIHDIHDHPQSYLVFQQTFNQFLFLRSFIGFFEAGFVVITPALLKDMYSDSKVALAIGFHSASTVIGM